MGLFGLFGKPSAKKSANMPDPEEIRQQLIAKKPLSEHLSEISTEYLRDEVYYVTQIGYNPQGPNMYLSIERNWSYPYNTLNVKDILECLEARGDYAVAAYWLGVFYEIGILESDDSAEEAQRHYNIASVQGCKYKDIIEEVRAKANWKPNLMVDEKESFVFCHNTASIEYRCPDIYAALSPEDRDHLSFVFMAGMAKLSEAGYPNSSVFLAATLFNKKQDIREGGLRDLFEQGIGHRDGEAVIRRMIALARGGNQYAVEALKARGWDYRKNYS